MIPIQSGAVASHNHLTHPKYRPDIDGLRAVAILSVVGFHAFPEWIKGGFIGVDIFFVISGYLISTIIFDSLEHKHFSFAEFYSRRIKRIFPALLVVLVSCFVFGWFALLADEYKQLGKHIAGGAGFVSNFIFWNESSYFDNAAETKPLLHLWSLGIEEQFYIVWPLLLWLAWKRNFNFLTITLIVVLISFVLNISKVGADAVATFYSPQTRFWELLAGSILAYTTLHRPQFKHSFDAWLGKIIFAHPSDMDGKALRNIKAFVGAGLIAAGVLVITKEYHFPGWWALLPILGAVLLISAGTQAWLNRVVLSNKILVWFGLISFPLYLWHWPLLAFARIVESETPSRQIRIVAVLLSVLLAWLTYRLIEKPIRFGNHGKAKTIGLFVLMAIVGVVGYNIYKRDGLEFRKIAQIHAGNEGDIGFETYNKYSNQNFYLCTPLDVQQESLAWDPPRIRCFQSQRDAPINIALIGDSHSEHLFEGLAEALPQLNIASYVRGGMVSIDDKAYQLIFNSVISDSNIKSVILADFWAMRLGNDFDPDKKSLAGNTTPDDSLGFKAELTKTVNALLAANKKVYLAEDIPTFPFDPQKCKFSRPFSLTNRCIEDRDTTYGGHSKYFPFFQKMARENPNVQIISMSEHFCGRNYCSMAKDGVLLYRDTNHLNINGSRYLGKKIVEQYPQLAN